MFVRMLMPCLVLAAVGCANSAAPPAAVGSSKAAAMRQRRQTKASDEAVKKEPAASDADSAAAEVKPGSAQSPLLAILDDARAEEVTSHLAIPNKVNRYAERVVAQYDRNGDGVLSADEWQSLRGNAALADFDHDGTITPAELAQRIAIYSLRRSLRLRAMPLRTVAEGAPVASGDEVAALPTPRPKVLGAATGASDEQEALRTRPYYTPRSRLPSGVDEWFLETDGDGDGQITMREFTAHLSEGDVTRFASLDPNGDGVVTAAEYAVAKSKEPATETPADGSPMEAPGMPPMPAPMLQR